MHLVGVDTEKKNGGFVFPRYNSFVLCTHVHVRSTSHSGKIQSIIFIINSFGYILLLFKKNRSRDFSEHTISTNLLLPTPFSSNTCSHYLSLIFLLYTVNRHPTYLPINLRKVGNQWNLLMIRLPITAFY